MKCSSRICDCCVIIVLFYVFWPASRHCAEAHHRSIQTTTPENTDTPEPSESFSEESSSYRPDSSPESSSKLDSGESMFSKPESNCDEAVRKAKPSSARLYSWPDSLGASILIQNYCSNLGNCSPDGINYDNVISSACVTGMWLFYEDYDYGPDGHGAMEYAYGTNFCFNFNYVNDAASSVRYVGKREDYMASGITVYQHRSFKGAEYFTSYNVPTFPKAALQGWPVSAIISGNVSWTLYEFPFYGGRSLCLHARKDYFFPTLFLDEMVGVPIPTLGSVRKGCVPNKDNTDVHPSGKGRGILEKSSFPPSRGISPPAYASVVVAPDQPSSSLSSSSSSMNCFRQPSAQSSSSSSTSLLTVNGGRGYVRGEWVRGDLLPIEPRPQSGMPRPRVLLTEQVARRNHHHLHHHQPPQFRLPASNVARPRQHEHYLRGYHGKVRPIQSRMEEMRDFFTRS